MKDRFDRTDPAWDEMLGIVRGEGPLQPQKAASLGYSANDSPLFKLYQAFRRQPPPKARVAGGWANVLSVKDNDRAEEMARKFREGIAEYQVDTKWWELVEEEDNRLLTPSAGVGTGGLPSTSGGGDVARLRPRFERRDHGRRECSCGGRVAEPATTATDADSVPHKGVPARCDEFPLGT